MNKHLLCTVADDGFVAMTRVMLHSFEASNPWFNGDVIIFHGGHKCTLSEASQEKLSNCCSMNIRFEDVGETYLPIMEKVLKYKPNEQNIRTLVGFYKYEVFRGRDFDRAVMLDGDMLILNDLSYLFDHSSHTLACPDAFSHAAELFLKPSDKYPGENNEINTGLLSVKPSRCFYNSLYEYALDFDYKNKKVPRNEQTVLSRFLDDKHRCMAPSSYNMLRRGLHSKSFRRGCWKRGHIIHYTGPKPTSPENSGGLSFRLNGKARHYGGVMDLWRDYNKKFFSDE